ncbi:MAG: hypothetical protein CMM49_02110 [Rhodospirillaceae bacterium]|nr:hypothetical protein [Rhodospirillaceae bacterium]|tara:strand:- start:237 stop:929 length:693 start_codon:yes stop_codon:yes gene_type:complete
MEKKISDVKNKKNITKDQKKFSIFRRLRAYFLTGIVVTAPIGITIWLAIQAINFFDSFVSSFIPVKYNPETYLQHGLPGSGVIVIVLLLTLIGALAANFLGRFFLKTSERILNRTPVIRTIYGALKQIFAAVIQQQSGSSFREVVLIEYPRKGIWAIGFISSETKGEVLNNFNDDMLNIFLPTTPNPTSGFLLFVPKKDVIKLNMSVEEGIKLVISAGLVTPKVKNNTNK